MRNYILILLVLFVFAIACNENQLNKTQNQVSDKILAAKIYDYKGDFDELFEKWKSLGLNTAFVSRPLFGQEAFRKAARQRNIALYLIYPVFYNPDTLAKNEQLYAITNKGNKAVSDWVHFVCPTNSGYLQSLTKDIKEIANTTPPDAFSVDFIRQFFYWEMVKPDTPFDGIEHGCYCENCLLKFQVETKVAIPDSLKNVEEKANWLNTVKKTEWQTWRESVIENVVKSISETIRKTNPEVKVNLHIVPSDSENDKVPLREVAAQNLRKIGKYADYVSPMCYSFMLYQPADWVNAVVKDMQNETKAAIIPSVQVSKCYRSDSLSTLEFENCCNAALKDSTVGCVFFSWDYLIASPAKQKAWKACIDK